MSGTGHLVVRAPNWVGDLVMATPVLAGAFEEGSPWARVTILLRRPLDQVLADAPFLPPAAETGPGPGPVVAIGAGPEERAALEALVPDAVLLLSNSFGAALRAWRAGVPRRIGSALSGRRALLTDPVPAPADEGRRRPIPTAELLVRVAERAGIRTEGAHPRLGVAPAVEEAAAAELAALGIADGEPYVLCCPGAAFGASKLWPIEHFAAVLDELERRHGWRAVVAGGPAEDGLVAAVVARCAGRAVALGACERGLERLKALARAAALVLVGDSGPRWFAAAFDVPCVTVMGPNFPELTASSLERCEVVRTSGLECAPCLERRCPLGHHRCMRELRPARVLEASERVLAGGPGGAR